MENKHPVFWTNNKKTENRGPLSWPGDDYRATEREYSHASASGIDDEPLHECEGNVLSIEGFGVKVEKRRNMTNLQLGPEFAIQKNETSEDHFKRINLLLEKALKENHQLDMKVLEQDFKNALRQQIVKITNFLSK